MSAQKLLIEQPRPAAVFAAQHKFRRVPLRLPSLKCQAAPQDPDSATTSQPSPGQKAERAGLQIGAPIQRRTLINLAGGAAVAALCPCAGCTPAAKAGEGAGPWEYGQLEGPKLWGGTCQLGATQSPIDVPLSSLFVRGGGLAEGMGAIEFDFPSAGRAAVLNTGHGTMQVNVPNGQFFSRIGGRVHELIQFHFHTPSEHTFDGRHYPMEAHLVHKDVLSGGLAVLGVMLKRGDSAICLSNPALQWALSYAPCYPQATLLPLLPVNVKALLPKMNDRGERPYVHYSGSLTTPPCSEQVKWFVFTDPVTVTDKQILDFGLYCGGGKSLGTNARPTLPIGERPLQYYA